MAEAHQMEDEEIEEAFLTSSSLNTARNKLNVAQLIRKYWYSDQRPPKWGWKPSPAILTAAQRDASGATFRFANLIREGKSADKSKRLSAFIAARSGINMDALNANQIKLS